ncbi:hypothetical protein TUM20985_28080 [Mycobacterium antarcticum]|nr:hypothetical protein TUM20985_28080 [Mycolicibacterium sp. TUM20985]GLP84187.1 hypothetical protein TUM20984_56070 [Mycolicibacterium sp. TUM20984]
MVRTLPVNAIKVLSIRADDGRVDMPSQGVAPHAAFEAVGASYDRPTVVVEDRLAAALVRFAIKGLPIADSVDVKFIPGGAETLWSHYVPMWAHDERGGLLLLLDGDQKTDEPVASGNVAPDHLEEVVVASLNGNEPKLPYGSSEEESAGHRRESLRAVLDWRRMFVNFLPVDTPEEFLLRSRDSRLEQKTLHDEERKVKGAWLEIATQELGRPASGDEIFVFQQAEISKLSASDETVSLIAGIVQGFVESVKL